jgi:hypothetical protein
MPGNDFDKDKRGRGDVPSHIVPTLSVGRLLDSGFMAYEPPTLGDIVPLGDRIFQLARSAAVDLMIEEGIEADDEQVQAESRWGGQALSPPNDDESEPSIGVYIAARNPVAAGSLGVLFQRLDSVIRRQLGYDGFDVRVDVEYLAQGSVFARLGVQRRSRKKSRSKSRTEPWKRADKIAVMALLATLAGLARDTATPFGKANQNIIVEGNATIITYSDGANVVGVSRRGVSVSPGIADMVPPPAIEEALAPPPPPPPPPEFVHDADIIVEPEGVFAVLVGVGPTRYSIVDHRQSESPQWQDGSRYSLIGKLIHDRDLTTGIEVRAAFKLAG